MALESADKILSKPNEQRLRDLDWDNRGPGQIVPKFGQGGKVIGGTTRDIEIGWAAENVASLHRHLDQVEAKLDQFAKLSGIVIDNEAIAKAVVDEQAKRLASPTLAAPEEGK